MELLQQVAVALLPSVGIGFLFYKIMRLLFEGDRKERAAYANWLAEQDARRAADGDVAGVSHDSAAVADRPSPGRV